MIIDEKFFVAQRNAPGRRGCGPAALAMILRSFGIPAQPDTLWEELQSYPGASGRHTKTFHLARNALEKGLAALPVRLRDPWSFLESIDQEGAGRSIRAILNHRVRIGDPEGHFSVPVRVDPGGSSILIHDPQFGPNRRLLKAELLELWKSGKKDDEVTGNVAVLFAKRSGAETNCVRCPGMFFPEPFREYFGIAIQRIFCPFCDAVVNDRRP